MRVRIQDFSIASVGLTPENDRRFILVELTRIECRRLILGLMSDSRRSEFFRGVTGDATEMTVKVLEDWDE